MTFEVDGATYERPKQSPYIVRDLEFYLDLPIEPVYWYGKLWGHLQLRRSTRIRWTTSFGETFDFAFYGF